MNGATYDAVTATIFAVVMTVFIFIIGSLIPNEPNREGEAH